MKVKDYLIFILLVMVTCQPLSAQKFKDTRTLKVTAGVDGSLMIYRTDAFRYHDAEASARLVIPVWNEFQVGVRGSYIQSWGNRVVSQDFYMWEAFLEYRFVKAGRFDVFAHSGIASGNYCDCDIVLPPYQDHGVLFIVFGPRATYQLGEHFFASAAIYLQPIINKKPEVGWANKPFVGVEYRF